MLPQRNDLSLLPISNFFLLYVVFDIGWSQFEKLKWAQYYDDYQKTKN